MAKKILIAEDEFVEANDIQIMLTKAGYNVCGIARSVDVALKLVEKEQPDFVLVDIFLKGKLTGIDLARRLNEMNVPFIYISANSNEEVLSAAKTMQPYGFIVKPFREKDLLVTLEIAQYRNEHSLESEYRREKDLQRRLEAIDTNNSVKEKLLQTAMILQQYIPFDLLTAGYKGQYSADFAGYSFRRTGFNEYQVLEIKELALITRKDPKQLADIYSGNEKLFRDTLDMQSSLQHHLNTGYEQDFCLCFYNRRAGAYSTQHSDLLKRLDHLLIKNIQSAGQAQIYVNSQGTATANTAKQSNFDGVVGSSYVMMNVFDKIMQVAPYDTSVLILGESGTGKERIADLIHRHSDRREKPFVKVNCAALPPTLIESELFGHEKGAFTGATDKRIGKFLQAHGGTIFLDEIGEMPVDLQVKLLRVLQEKEIEPIGGRTPVKVNVRIIAATNRNLEKEVAEARFRLDLYYRLNVFPILLPPLRERKEDIPSLALHFISQYNRKANKKIEQISDKILTRMQDYNWPGNIRELENLIERGVLMTRGPILENIDIPAPSPVAVPDPRQDTRVKTINEIERDHILTILAKTNGRIWGTGGAAELLNIPPTTLSSKMKKLGITKVFGLKR